ncbi:uncharacterized protein MELLADRAFT_91597 [Melampsora larici-populina 98AG31]|uniref:Uncharacterized protein n=1 Tax=Melampsora larici-populina (strain 98AG31 / pathotype 3-4-7) TaxID=747676 RepID=F4RZM0_MELLP|nr:uncharacterized protein MELLADRAFT_91597 [Melampsora larici-populina 98AG31]EGG02027.1 hypothetical protein MELLADRAFT_91597 [Melampsora larici-populina 98AG31]
MVAGRLSNVVMQFNHTPPNYVHALSSAPSFGPEEAQTTTTSTIDTTADRITMFNSYGLLHLRSGQYRLAAENLDLFVKMYNFLNAEEISAIATAQMEARETLRRNTSLLGQAHQAIEQIQLLLREPKFSSEARLDLDVQLKIAIDVGFLAALENYHNLNGQCSGSTKWTNSSIDLSLTLKNNCSLYQRPGEINQLI